MIDLSQLIRPLRLPPDFSDPAELKYEDLKATPLQRSDCEEDLVAVNSSRDLIRSTRGGSWPGEELTWEFNFLDLAWHERENRDGSSLAYAIRTVKGEYIGCFYLYPLGTRRPLSQKLLNEEYAIDTSWWTTKSAYDRGYYELLYKALQHWLSNELKSLGRPYFTNHEIPN